MSGSGVAFFIGAALALPASARDEGAEFRDALAQVQQLIQRGSFDRAEKQLGELLLAHEGADHARLHRTELVEMARRCAFRRTHAEPKLDDLVSGELVRYDAKTGDLEVRYRYDTVQDFERTVDDRRSDTILTHPAAFAGPYTIELESPATRRGGLHSRMYVGLGTDEAFVVSFGTGDDEKDSYYPPRIMDFDGNILDEQAKPAAPFDAKYSLKVVVQSGSVTAYRDGKRILQAKRKSREFGAFAVVNAGTNLERLTVKGKVQPSWLQGRLDAAMQKQLDAFDKSWKPADALPAWLFEAKGAEAADAAAAPEPKTPNRLLAARLVELKPTLQKSSLAERVAIWSRLIQEFPDEPALRYRVAHSQLLLGRIDDAQATLDAARAAGIPAKELDPLPRIVLQARTGPTWTRVFVHETTYFVVKSDIDKEICVEAAKILEESYRSYRQRLAPVPDAEKRKFAVFLFAGQAGYKDYSGDVNMTLSHNTAGVYSGLLKQLLIWNLPDRRAMLRTVRHEGFHQYLDRLAERPPVWFNEGLAEYYELADLYGGEWKEGQVNADHVETLTDPDSKWVPLRTLFELDSAKFYGDPDQNYAQSWAVVQYLRQGPKEAQEVFKRMWSAAVAGKGGGEIAAEGFSGVDLDRFEADLKSYVLKLGR